MTADNLPAGSFQIWIARRRDGMPILETAAWSADVCAAFVSALRESDGLTVAPFTLSPTEGTARREAAYPSVPRLSPDGRHYICDQCGREWQPGTAPGCEACSKAFDALDRQARPSP